MDSNNIQYNKKRIRKLILDYTASNKGETQKTVADKIGVALTTLFYHNPTIETLCKAANFFQRDINYFFDIPNSILIEGAKNSLVANPDADYEVWIKQDKERMEDKISDLEKMMEKMINEIIDLKNNQSPNNEKK
ncbi:helix-turn-helix domain-containing protein [Paludibacteraceae bacterium OttesenSCG-928-F17]|nr:helix-turn-helix domain-containing protein [Paludibacteraceae bacterium OttesenSCG-928-F17]